MPPTNPAPATPPRKKTSTLMKVVYVIIILVVLSLVLQALGFGVMDRREADTLIERPHAE
ncbi:hypothetical protein GGR28_002272 [Lewinella aquimaris]|uniref:Uncharacterized protein n=1 Tax=Neolewinella aquimaris TaxID=1835722 RepID=A0A840E8K4_9BACT|nr:hypothetical protein [Neolewinella aquimaris]MBB4079647.1 hypothetical protein [Neolewinella aquimaris]